MSEEPSSLQQHQNQLPPSAQEQHRQQLPSKSCAKCARVETDTQKLIPCPNCFSVFYCSPLISSCQQTHFPIHQDECMMNSSLRKKKGPSATTTTTTTVARRDRTNRTKSASPRSRSRQRRSSSWRTPRANADFTEQGRENHSDDEMPSLVDYQEKNEDAKEKVSSTKTPITGVEISTQTREADQDSQTHEQEQQQQQAAKPSPKYHNFKEKKDDENDDDDEPPPLDPLQDGTIVEFPKIETKQYAPQEERDYQDKMNYFRGVEFQKEANTLITDEKLQRAMVEERARMERQDFERGFERDLIQTRDLMIEAVRSKLKQQSTFTAYHQQQQRPDLADSDGNNNSVSSTFDSAAARKIAQDELTKLNEMVEGMKGYLVDPREVDVQLFKSRNVLLQAFQKDISAVFRQMKGDTTENDDEKKKDQRVKIPGADLKNTFTVPTKPPSQLPFLLFPASQNSEVAQELSLKERCKIVVQIKDLCDKLKAMKMNVLDSPTRYASIEQLYLEGVDVANRIPVAGTLTLMATKAELERFLRIYQV